jgi:hypothetical protein
MPSLLLVAVVVLLLQAVALELVTVLLAVSVLVRMLVVYSTLPCGALVLITRRLWWMRCSDCTTCGIPTPVTLRRRKWATTTTGAVDWCVRQQAGEGHARRT